MWEKEKTSAPLSPRLNTANTLPCSRRILLNGKAFQRWRLSRLKLSPCSPVKRFGEQKVFTANVYGVTLAVPCLEV